MFGFASQDDQVEQQKLNYSELLSSQKEIHIGLHVKSALNNVCGKVTMVDNTTSYGLIYITWDNGNVSSGRKSDMNKVIVL